MTTLTSTAHSRILQSLSKTGLLVGVIILFVVGALLSDVLESVPNQLNILRRLRLSASSHAE